MSINEELSFTEYTLTESTTDFIISFDRIGGSTDEVSILVDNTPIEDLVGYTVTQVNYSTWRVDPALPSGTVVRLARTTNLDQMVYVFTAGAKFIAKNVDSNFKQIQHSQQEIRDRQGKLESDTTALFIEVNEVKATAEQAATDANEALEKVDEILNTGVVPAGMILTNSGQNQQQVNDFGGSKWYEKVGGYDLGSTVKLDNGDVVRSIIPNNIGNPNVDMTGWINLSTSILSVTNIAALRNYTPVSVNAKVNLKQHSNVLNEGGGNFQSFYSETPLTDNNGTLIKSSVVPNLYWKRVDFQAVTPEMFGAQALIDEDQAPSFNKMYLASELEGFICGGCKGRRYRIYTEVDIQGANATHGLTEFRLRSNDARLRIRAKSRARNFDIETNSGFTGTAVYLNGLDNWGTEYQNNAFDDFRVRNPSITGTAVFFDCTQPSSRIAYAHANNFRIEGFENGLVMLAAATSGWSFINANSLTNWMGGAGCKNFIRMIANKSAGGTNDVDSNKLISFEFQNKNGDNALYMSGCKLNTLLGQTYFDLSSADAVWLDALCENNTVQGAWLQPYEREDNKRNNLDNMNNSTTYKSYLKLRNLTSSEYIQRERFTLAPNNPEPVANEGSYFKTANTQATTIVRFRNVLEGKVISIFVDDDFTAFINSAYISTKSNGADLKAVKGCIYNFVCINGIAVLQDTAMPHVTNASSTIATGTQVFGASNATPIGRNSKWARVMCDDGVLRMYPVWDIPS